MKELHKLDKQELKAILDFAYEAYEYHHKDGNYTDSYYRQNGATPFITHPFLAASLLLADRKIPLTERILGYKILLLHDILEDTDQELPDFIDTEVQTGVETLTHLDNASTEEIQAKVKTYSAFYKLLTLCDMLSNMYEEHVSNSKRAQWKQGVLYLANEVEDHYGNCRIVQVAKTVCENTEW